MINVVIGVIEREGRLLIGQIMPHRKHPMKWEFPGGKVEAGEQLTEALARELIEELDIVVHEQDMQLIFFCAYPDDSLVTLYFYRISSYSDTPSLISHMALAWRTVDEIAAMGPELINVAMVWAVERYLQIKSVGQTPV